MVIRESRSEGDGWSADHVTHGEPTDLVTSGVPVRVHIPYGRDWFRYWTRRLAESRGA